MHWLGRSTEIRRQLGPTPSHSDSIPIQAQHVLPPYNSHCLLDRPKPLVPSSNATADRVPAPSFLRRRPSTMSARCGASSRFGPRWASMEVRTVRAVGEVAGSGVVPRAHPRVSVRIVVIVRFGVGVGVGFGVGASSRRARARDTYRYLLTGAAEVAWPLEAVSRE
jgi:hypothetical protein